MPAATMEPQPQHARSLADRQEDALGPILRFRGACEGIVRCSVTVAGPKPAMPGFAPIGTMAGLRFYSHDLVLAHDPGAERAELPDDFVARLPGLPSSIAVPKRGGALRVAFTSCNGAEDEMAAASIPGGRNAMWAHLTRTHEANPFHLLVMGGDQIYADGLWNLPSIKAWRRLPNARAMRAPFTDAMRKALERHYLGIYASVFGSPEVSAILARVPSVMIWDDHDIVDGYGSRKPDWQASPVANGLFDVARRAFALMQLGLDPDCDAAARAGQGFAANPDVGFGWSGDFGPARIVVPDLRSGRTRHRVLAPAGLDHLGDEIANADAAHRVVISSVPLVNADLSALERMLTPLMPLVDLYQDDLRDQWMSHAHGEQWAAIIGRLLDIGREARVSIVSGEIHLGAQGFARRGGASIEQFIASGIAHPPPPTALARGYEWFAMRMRRRGDIAVEMRPVAPDGRRYVAERNWLALTFEAEGTRRAVLHTERSGALSLAPDEDARLPNRRSGP